MPITALGSTAKDAHFLAVKTPCSMPPRRLGHAASLP